MTSWPARTLKSDCLTLGLVFLGEAIAPHPVRAQQLFHLNPSIAVTQVYDSNLFFTTSDRQADSIWRVTPAIDAEYRSMPWTVRLDPSTICILMTKRGVYGIWLSTQANGCPEERCWCRPKRS